MAAGIAVSLALAAPAAAQPLEAALAELLRGSPRIEAAQRRLQATQSGVEEARGEFLPRVELSGDGGYAHSDTPVRREAGQSPLRTDRGTATLSITQNLYDGSRRQAGLDVARFNAEIADQGREATLQSTLQRGIVAYHNVLRFQRLATLAAASEKTIATQLNLEDERVRQGGGIAVDVLLSKARLQIAKEQRVAFEGALRDALANYRQVFDAAAEPGRMVEPVPPMRALPDGVDAAIAVALGENPQVIGLDRTSRAAERQQDVAASEYYPRVDLVGRAGWEEDVDGVRGVRREAAILVRLTWEIFSGFATQARVAASASRYAASMADLTQTKREIAEEVRQSWNRLQTATERVDLLRNAVAIANEVFGARKRLREAGKESAINVLDAETELYTAQINFTNASYDARLAVYTLLRAMGRLNAATLNLPTG